MGGCRKRFIAYSHSWCIAAWQLTHSQYNMNLTNDAVGFRSQSSLPRPMDTRRKGIAALAREYRACRPSLWSKCALVYVGIAGDGFVSLPSDGQATLTVRTGTDCDSGIY